MRKSSLTAALQQATGRPAVPSPSSAPDLPSPAGTAEIPPSRTGKKTIAGHFDPAVSRQLRQLALEEDSSVQDLLREAINDLFEKKGKPRLA